MVEALVEEMRRHLADPFPDSVTKGLDYGEVDAVMIGANIYGWATQAVGDSLSGSDRARSFDAAEALGRSIEAFRPMLSRTTSGSFGSRSWCWTTQRPLMPPDVRLRWGPESRPQREDPVTDPARL